jgi:hypothetical protein
MDVLRKIYKVFFKKKNDFYPPTSSQEDTVKEVTQYIDYLSQEINELRDLVQCESDTGQCTWCGLDVLNPHDACLVEEENLLSGNNPPRRGKKKVLIKVKNRRKPLIRGVPDPPKTPWFGEVESFH